MRIPFEFALEGWAPCLKRIPFEIALEGWAPCLHCW